MSHFIDLTGKRFSRLLVMSRADGVCKGETRWNCICDCGRKHTVKGSHLRRGKIKSCGCLRDGLNRTHGLSESREYKTWENMKTRCNNPKNSQYKNYGARGIAVCERWSQSFEAFLEDMGKCPPGFTIERIRGDEGYKPGNCCWASQHDQSRNKRSNHTVTFRSRRMIVTDFAAILMVHTSTIIYWLKKGRSPDEIYDRFKRKET